MTDTLAEPFRHEEVIKKSRFIARASAAASPAAALEYIRAVSEAEATHNCWAYRLGAEYRFSDDGEPGGTAGRPILQAIDGHELDRVVVVVTRYFGGIKLGAGGLVRAYGGVASSCLRLAIKAPIVEVAQWELEVPFELSGAAHHWMERSGVRKVDEQFGAEGIVLTVELPEQGASDKMEQLKNATRGRIPVKRRG